MLLETIRDYAVFEMDPAGSITIWNTGAEYVTGFRREEAVGQTSAIIFTPEDREEGAPERELEAARASGRTEQERWHLRKDGSLFWGSGVLTCIFGDAGELTGFVKVIRDVTAQKRAQDRLRQSEQRLRLLAENVRNSALVQIDTAGRVVYWNPGAERIFGYTHEEICGREYALVFSREDVEQHVPEKEMAEALELGRAEYEHTLCRKDGTSFIAHWVTEPIADEQGRLQGFVKVLRDETESRRAEEQTRKSQRMEALGRLAGGVAHDFNNLLTIIGGYATLIEQKAGGHKDLPSALTQIQEAVRRAARLTAQLLVFSRNQVTEPAVLSVNDLLSGMEKMLRTLLGEDVELTFALDPKTGRVKADSGRIEQILINLAANARDAMPGGGKLRIETRNRMVKESPAGSENALEPGQYVTVTVSDTGHGMDDATRAHIFEPFFTTKPVDKGTGLGLATSYGIAHQSGGTLTVESRPGQGASFTLYLPRVRASARKKAKASHDQRGLRGSGTVLIVEDEAVLRSMFVQSLSEAGYSVLEARDGQGALRVAAEHDGVIDLLVTDVVMPQLGGADLARDLQKQRPGMNVLFVSGYTNQALEARGVLVGRERLLQKPFRLEDLLEAVRAVMKEGRPQGGISAAN
ncbi:MAG: two-component system, cell cycle sensor histidine kinase and response regulator CckA [Bryobacterales bacterium]|nr:two-component system, cell cycle sensor histidine kinase and response regulator CckA [Bryobacterales bacterium]